MESYNFLLTDKIWNLYKTNGKLSPLSSFTIVNANDKFVQYNEAGDAYFKETLKKRNIKVENGLKLVEIKKENQTAVW